MKLKTFNLTEIEFIESTDYEIMIGLYVKHKAFNKLTIYTR